ncbi:hypothetical protein [Streptomyces sp. CoH17]|uniref:hypothetical protein n=1 Tax=Streptomyces sp. CoH17 TaxID=2992806 RepID=UPI00226D75AC|nr:hypothetical protein [Streptomyces sp. CoH17]
MSLTVHVFVLDADGRRQVLDAPDDAYESAGFEDWRARVWGSPVVSSLGAVLLPVLAERDLEVPPCQVPALLRECLLLREKLEEIVANTEPVRTVAEHRSAIDDRLRTLVEVAGRAQATGGGVIIW